MRYFYHPESDSLWAEEKELAHIHTDGLVEEISYEEFLTLQTKQKGTKPMLQDYDASKFTPMQPGAMGGHPPGIFDFQISNTYLKPSKDNQHLLLYVEFTTPAGMIKENFIVDGTSPQAIEIAQKQIAAMCHATNIHRLSFPKAQDGSPIFDQAARELRGGRGRIEIAPQKDKDGKETGYMEIKKFFDVQGNEPGKAPAQQQPQQQQPNQQAPMTQQPNNGGWASPQQQPQQQPQQNPAPGGGWQPGPTGGNSPAKAPWQ